MAFSLECAQSFSASDASEADINRAFDDDAARGEYIILTAPDGGFIQAFGEMDGLYVLEYHDETSKKEFRASRKLSKTEVRQAFLQYFHGNPIWQTTRQWNSVKSGGCLSIVVGLGTIVTWTALTLGI